MANETFLNPELEASPKRTDRGRLHVVRNSVLSRGLLEALRRNGTNIRSLREMERGLRDALRPRGPLGQMFFDRFWASTLRMILASQLEETRLTQKKSEQKSPVYENYGDFLPALVAAQPKNDMDAHAAAREFDYDLPHQLALIARYDRAAAKEMYRSLSILLTLRDQPDDSVLKDWAAAMAGIRSNSGRVDHEL